MPIYKVTIREVRTYSILVEADDMQLAEIDAMDQVADCPHIEISGAELIQARATIATVQEIEDEVTP